MELFAGEMKDAGGATGGWPEEEKREKWEKKEKVAGERWRERRGGRGEEEVV